MKICRAPTWRNQRSRTPMLVVQTALWNSPLESRMGRTAWHTPKSSHSPTETGKPPQQRRLYLLYSSDCFYFISTPPAFFFAFSASFALRAPMARCAQSSAFAKSSLRAASLPHSMSALRRYVRFRYCMASS